MNELDALMYELLYIYLFGMNRDEMNTIAKTHRDYGLWGDSRVDECITDCLSLDALEAITETINQLIPMLQAQSQMSYIDGMLWVKTNVSRIASDTLIKRGIASGDYLYAWNDSGFPNVDKSIPTKQHDFFDKLDSNE